MRMEDMELALKMKSEYEAGATTRAIAEKYFYSVETVKKKLKAVGVTLSAQRRDVPPKMTEEQIIEAHKFYMNGLSVNKVADRYDISGAYMSTLFRRRGMALRTNSGGWRARRVKAQGLDEYDQERKYEIQGGMV